MKVPEFHSAGGSQDRPEDGHGDGDGQQRLLEQALNARGMKLRERDGLADRIRSRTPLTISQRFHTTFTSVDGWRARWGLGLAVAAALAAAVFVSGVFDSRTSIPPQQVVASADQGGTNSEPVLVSLLAGSEIIADSGTQEFEVDDGGAMPILRVRDASFGDLHAEVQLILASAGTP